ncbi:PIN domain-containing protein [Thiocapsa sp.]|uniref:PIN domain-containing protein n=1 Tax=Thiocapsa sp. TaxID=2024551 RepID=UPI002C17B697|nr:PIN domain-containing protein [Thiocapsa sp.]HSO83546.1 PIN domain-containing protein [Thiocapsa sp.]
MAGHARYTAVLDACVLYSIAMTDALLSLAAAGLDAAKWTTRIEDEWIRALENSRPDLAGRLDVRRDCMRAAVPDWEVVPEQWQRLDLAVELPDPDDLHVLSAAIAGHADCDDLDDLALAEQRLEEVRAGRSKPTPLEDVMKRYGLED